VNERIVIEVPKGESAQAVALLIRDALSDFRRTREPSDYYVKERYPAWTEERQDEKVARVEGRLALSKRLVVETWWHHDRPHRAEETRQNG
jgi:hypothetical protein